MVTAEKTDSKMEKFKLNWMRTRLAHEGMMLDKIQRQSQIVEQLAAQTRDGKFKGGPAPSVPEDPDMGVSIGNETHNHYEGGSKPLGLLSKLIVAASLLAGGAGVGALVSPFLPTDSPVAVDPSIDTDTRIDVTFPE